MFENTVAHNPRCPTSPALLFGITLEPKTEPKHGKNTETRNQTRTERPDGLREVGTKGNSGTERQVTGAAGVRLGNRCGFGAVGGQVWLGHGTGTGAGWVQFRCAWGTGVARVLLGCEGAGVEGWEKGYLTFEFGVFLRDWT